MNIFIINTTAFEEENFHLITDLTKAEIVAVITPIVLAERNREEGDEDSFYDNGDLIQALVQKYPHKLIQDGGQDEETISI
jgi:hypothetical protein